VQCGLQRPNDVETGKLIFIHFILTHKHIKVKCIPTDIYLALNSLLGIALHVLAYYTVDHVYTITKRANNANGIFP